MSGGWQLPAQQARQIFALKFVRQRKITLEYLQMNRQRGLEFVLTN